MVVTECCFSPFLPRDSKNFTHRFKSLSNLQMSKFDRAMSQQSAVIVPIYIEQKRYFVGISFTV